MRFLARKPAFLTLLIGMMLTGLLWSGAAPQPVAAQVSVPESNQPAEPGITATPDARLAPRDPLALTAQPITLVFTFLPTLVLPTSTRTPTPINIGNFVWDDLDGDGRQDAGEPGLPGVTVQLWNSSKSALLDSDVTDSSGFYTVVAPIFGDYRVRVVLPNLLDQFTVKDAADGDNTKDSDINSSGSNIGFTDIINIPSNVISISNVDAGIVKFRTPTPTRTPTPINIGNFVWDDLDGDGRQDAGEPGLSGVTVQLWNSSKTSLLNSDVTDSSGFYTVVAPIFGDYRVRVILPNLLDQFTVKDAAGSTDTTDSDINSSGSNIGFTDIINIPSNVISISNVDAGIIRFRTPTPTRTPTPINIGNFVWNDLDGDGQQDAGEPGLNGITVQLWDGDKTTLLASDVTDSSGFYTVVAPLPGEYRVRVLLPAGASFTAKDQANGDDTKDSDINKLLFNIGYTDVIDIASNVISISNIDAGMINVPATATYTPTPLKSSTPTPSKTVTVPPAATPTKTATATKTKTPTPTKTATATKTKTPTPTNVAGATPTKTATATKTKTAAATIPQTPGVTPSPTITPTLAAGVELLINGDFEVTNDSGKPELAPWILKDSTGDKIQCNKDTDGDSIPDKFVSFSGNCAFRFKGGTGEKAKLTQKVVVGDFTFAAGDTLQLNLHMQAKSASASGKIKVQVKYADEAIPSSKVSLPISQVSSYQLFATSLVLTHGELAVIKVQITHRSPAGKVWLDVIHLRQVTGGARIPLP